VKASLVFLIVAMLLFLPACSCIFSCNGVENGDNNGGSNGSPVDEEYAYRDEFDSLDTDFWSFLQWVTLQDAQDLVMLREGELFVQATVVDRVPFLLSKPIPVQSGAIVTIERRVRLTYSNQYFDGGMSILGVDSDKVSVSPDPSAWNADIRNHLVRINYLYFFYEPDNKPATDGFVLWAEDPADGTPYIVSSSVFDEWFVERITWNTGTGLVVYEYNGITITGTAKTLDSDYIRIMMHGYGWFTGHIMELDYFEITITPAD